MPIPLTASMLSVLQRTLLLTLFTPALVLLTLSAVPALTVLPFFACGTDRALRILGAHTGYAKTLLQYSQGEASASRQPRNAHPAVPARRPPTRRRSNP
ncbi:dTMP kinase [Kitasatospora arboriphila]|uniref:dTMP kinase n=1 Tax=Kitasatospora arboriphila TaxID=258052 RepID=A0ABP4EFY2_9ACTN